MPAAGRGVGRGAVVAAAVPAAVWAVLLTARGRYWRTDLVLVPAGTAPPGGWPDVSVVVPARDEAAVLPDTLPTLLGQDYPGRFGVLLVDDGSTDGTADVAHALAPGAPADRFQVLAADPRPAGWAGKVWAQHCALLALDRAGAGAPPWVLLTDADIAHPPDSLRRLVLTADASGLDLVSLMALLRVETGWERLLVPAFVYFFAQLYPFAWVGDPRRRTAAAAGGCVLVRREVLDGLDRLEAVRGALIDDVALARAAKRRGHRVWLGLSRDVRSARPYPRLADLWAMVTRSAYTQLRHDPLLLAGTVAGLVVTYLAPPVLAAAAPVVAVRVFRRQPVPVAVAVASGSGVAATAAMVATYRPVVRHFGLRDRWALALPISAALYLGMTVHSAWQHHRGSGAAWKGRAYAS